MNATTTSGLSVVKSTPPEKLFALQALRAIAAILVTISHATEESQYFFEFTPFLDTTPFGKGVDLFFVISGFIIYHTSKKLFDKPNAMGTFVKNRFIRVVPLYYLFTTLMVLVVYFLPTGVKEARFDPVQIASSYLFMPYERYDGRIAPILSLGWTLNYEMFFYAIFSLCLFLKGRFLAIAAISAIILLALLGAFLPPDAPAAFRMWTSGIILEFGAGIAIAYYYEFRGANCKGSTTYSALVIGAGFFLLYVLNLPEPPLNIPRYLSAGLPASMIVGASVLLIPATKEQSIPRWLVSLGDSSYSLYLSHRFVQRPIQILFNQIGLGRLEVAGALYISLAVAASCLVGHLVYLVIEQPMLRKLRNGLGSRKLPQRKELSSS